MTCRSTGFVDFLLRVLLACVLLACGEAADSPLPGRVSSMEALLEVAIPTALELHAGEDRRSRARVEAMYSEELARSRTDPAVDSFYAALSAPTIGWDVITMRNPESSAVVDPVARAAWTRVAPRWQSSSVDSWRCQGPVADNHCTLDGLAVSLSRLVVEDDGHARVQLMITEQTSESDLGHTYYDMKFALDAGTWSCQEVQIGYAH